MIISMLVGATVIALMVGVGLAMSRSANSLAEQRLDDLTGSPKAKGRGKADLSGGLLLRPSADRPGRLGLLDQAAARPREAQHALRAGRRQPRLQAIPGDRRGAGGGGGRAGVVFGVSIFLIPVGSAFLAALPFLWLSAARSSGSRSSSTRCPRPSS
jgi:hypothetical protein